jgi:phage repressor protein C with HTH and peptisase S24 domain
MGGGQLVISEQIIDSLAFKADWIKHEIGANPKNLVLISAVGDSMEPTLRSGDLLLIDLSSNQIKHDAIYVIALDDELLAKRMQRLVDGTIIVKSDNTLYREQTLEQEKLAALRIIGRVVWVCRKI